ncbi:hypothetical protein IAG41_08535 [Sphingomonas sp. JC676]|uniref:hypothetical protein n=1 Tax=Sphingomonas sp. JC676 TaxID=2768065 RepID=UPI001657EFA4|nr:hypothetical protein [Sphingomonas sp. JC676]MBC9032435.1 hypothetical protein [Sphingomonas sp. JC676]
MICATAVTLAAPMAFAQQDAPAPAPTPSPSRTPGVFTLPGVVPERYSLPGGTPVPVSPPATTVSPSPIAIPTPSAVAPSRRIERPRVERRPTVPERAIEIPAPVPTPTAAPTPASAPPIATPTPAAAPAPLPPAAQPAMPGWLWMLIGAAATAMLGGAAWLLLRRRAEPIEEEEVVFAETLPVPPPHASPPPLTPPPPPRPAPAPPSRLQSHPFEIGIRPVRIELGERDVTLDFELLIGSLQSDPAEAIRLSLAMMSASPDQDNILAGFHRGPPGEVAGEPFDLAPGSGVRMPVRLLLARDRIHVVEVRGRPMFVAMALVDLRWRSGLSIRRYGADFMLGAAGQGDRIGPIWLDRGSPTGPLGATRYVPREAVAA